jgi:hypothetical protein
MHILIQSNIFEMKLVIMNDVQQSYSVEFTNMFDISSSPEIDTLFVVIEIRAPRGMG